MNEALSGYLEKFGSNFLIASMIPSLGLVIAVLSVFDPIFKISDMFNNPTGIYQLVGVGLFILVPTVIFGFTLTALNTYILKFFEGYVFLHRFSCLRETQFRRAQKLAFKRDTIKKRIKVLEKQIRTSRQEKILIRLKNQYYEITEHYDKNYPPDPEQVLPTSFGNILRAAETYSGTRYGIDGVEFWPRLLQVIPPRYQSAIDNVRNQLSFLVNMTILGLLFFILCLLAIFYSFISRAFDPLQTQTFLVILGENIRYLLAGLVALICLFFFQKASIFSVGSFGIMIRSSYDLFRIDLLKQFHLTMPATSILEYKTWKNLGELIILGQHHLNFKPLEYHFDEKKPQEIT